MFRFLGEIGSSRKKRKARRFKKEGKKNEDHSREKSNRPRGAQKKSHSCCKPSKQYSNSLRMKNLDQFFDSMSIETSLYTTPSKPTIQYPRGTRASENIDWHSSQGSEDLGPGTEFTAEFALAQYRLGGWQSPPIIETSLTPSTKSSTSSSSSLRKLRHEKGIIEDEAESSKACHSDYIEITPGLRETEQNVHSSLHTVDNDHLLVVNAQTFNLEVCSTTSSEISWNFDSLAFHEKLASSKAINHLNTMTTGSGENMTTNDNDGREKGVRRNMGNDEDSACSSVSSLSTDRFGDDRCKSIISSWSPSSLPTSFFYDRSPLKSDRVSSTDGSNESLGTERSLSKGTRFSTKNDSISSNDSFSTPVTFNADEQLSFSELISRYEGESLAKRLAPCHAGQDTTLLGRTDTYLDMPKFKIKSIESSRSRTGIGCILPSKEKKINVVTPKIRNVSTSLSDCDRIIPKASNTNIDVEVEEQTMNDISIVLGSSNDCIDFPGKHLFDYNNKIAKASNSNTIVDTESQMMNDVLITNGPSNDSIDFPRMFSKVEENSLQCNMGPSLPGRLARKKFRITTDVYEGKEILNCSNHELQEYKCMQNSDDMVTSQQKNQRLYNSATSGSSSHCNEEISSFTISTRLNGERKSACSSGILNDSNEVLLEASHKRFSSAMKKAFADIHTVADNSFESSSVVDTMIKNHQKHPNVELVDSHDNIPIYARCKSKEGSTTLLELESNLKKGASVVTLNPEEICLDMTSESNFLTRGQCPYDGPVDLDELIENGLQPNIKVQNSKSKTTTIPKKSVYRYTSTESDILTHDHYPYDGPVDLDEVLMAGLSSSPETLSENDNESTFPTIPEVKNEKEKMKDHHETEKENKKLGNLTVVDNDKLTSVSNNDSILDSEDFAELSLFPLSLLEHLTTNNAHDFLRKKVREHLKIERQRESLAEMDQEEDEWREQIRISVLTEQESTRRRYLNSPGLSHCIPYRVASPGLAFSKNQTSLNHQQTVTQPGSGFDDEINPYKFDQNEKTRITYSTSRVSESHKTYSDSSCPHKKKSFDYIKTALSLDTPNIVFLPIPLCAVCKVKERSQIAMPCMHYSFCSDCAEKLLGLETPICPICQTKDITLSRVYL